MVFEAMLTSAIALYGQIGLLVVMIIQTIIAPIPSEALLIFSGAIGIEIIDIVIFGGLGTIIGAIIAFYIARIGGKPIITRLIGKKWVGHVDGWVEKNGTWGIFLTRLIPIIPFDLISYMSGVTKLEFKYYLLATVPGALIRCFILAVAGAFAKGVLSLFGIGLDIVFIIGIIGFIILAYLDNKGYIDIMGNSIVKRVIKRE